MQTKFEILPPYTDRPSAYPIGRKYDGGGGEAFAIVGEAYSQGGTEDNVLSVARLFAAAPDMRQALIVAQATIERLDKRGSAKGTLDVIAAALAKADGKEGA
jgi:hypothetical protein